MSTKLTITTPTEMEGNSAYVTNLVNSIIGVSVLAMPFCLKQCGLILGLGLLFGAAWLTYISCSMLATSAFNKRRRTYEYLALYTLGPTGKFAVELSMIGMNLGTCVAFYVVIGDLSNGILSKFVDGADPQTLRIFTIVFCGLCIALPLGLMKSLSVLSYFGFFSLLFYCSFLVVVVLNAISNGLLRWEWFNEVNLWRPAGIFQCLPIFSLAYACQCQLFIVYDSLEEPSIRRIDDIVSQAIKFVTVVYMSVGFFGYTTYRDGIAGNLLVSFPSNLLLDFIKLGFAMSVVLGFPLIIFPCRQSIHTLFFSKPAGEGLPPNTYIPPFLFKSVTLAIVLSTMIVAIVIPNVETILGLTGATMGSMICFIFPALIYERAAPKGSGGIPKFVFSVGCLLLVVCTYTNLSNTAQDQVKAIEHPVVPAEVGAANGDVPAHVLENIPPAAVEQPVNGDVKKEPEKVEENKEPGAEMAEVIDDEHRHEPANPVDPDNPPVEDSPHEEEDEGGGVGVVKQEDTPNEENKDSEAGGQPHAEVEKDQKDVIQPVGGEVAAQKQIERVVDAEQEVQQQQAVQQKPPKVVGQQNVQQPGDMMDAVDQNVRLPENDGSIKAQGGDNDVRQPLEANENKVPGDKQEIRPGSPKEVPPMKIGEPGKDQGDPSHVEQQADHEDKPPEDKELLEKIKQQHEKQQQLLIEQEELIKKLEENQDKKEQVVELRPTGKPAQKPDGQNVRQPEIPVHQAAPGKVMGSDQRIVDPHQQVGVQPNREAKGNDLKIDIANDPLQGVPGPNVDGHGLAGRELLSDQKEKQDAVVTIEKNLKDLKEVMEPKQEEKPDVQDKNQEVVHVRAERSVDDEIQSMDKEKASFVKDDIEKVSNEGQLGERVGEMEVDAAEQTESIIYQKEQRKDTEKVLSEGAREDKNQKDSFSKEPGDPGLGAGSPLKESAKEEMVKDAMQENVRIGSLEEDADQRIEDCLENDVDCWRGKVKTRELKSIDSDAAVIDGA